MAVSPPMTSLPVANPQPLPAFNTTAPRPTFQDILDRLRQPLPNMTSDLGTFGKDEFERGIALTTPTGGIRPDTQRVLDMLAARNKEGVKRATDSAIALAGRRGLAGSSIEQFGASTAAAEVEKATRDAEANVLLQNLQNDQAMRELQARGLFDRSGSLLTTGNQRELSLAELDQQRRIAEAGLTSDEIASLRNKEFEEARLALETIMGNQSLDIARQNIGVSRDIAKEQNKNALLGTVMSSLLPGASNFIFGSPGSGSPGFLSSLFGGGGAGMSGVGTGQMVPGLGEVGTGVAAGGGGFGSFLPLAGLTVGGIAAYNALNDTGKALFAPLVNPLGTAKKIGNTVSKTVKKIFPF